jgi:hypothetical protein
LKKEEAHMTIGDPEALARQWRELEAADIPLAPLEDRVGIDLRGAGSDLTIRRGRDGWRSEIRELKNDRFAYILPVFIRRDRPGKTIIRDSWISTPWPAPIIDLLEDPRDVGRHPEWYEFPGDTERFWRDKVVNHRINGALSCGSIREGLVLAIGLAVPEDYKNHQQIGITFGILDQWDNEIVAKMQMRLNRLPALAKEGSVRRRSPLLSRRDVIVPGRSRVAPLPLRPEGFTKADEGVMRPIDMDAWMAPRGSLK